MPVRMELSRILIRELSDYRLIELREVAPTSPEIADLTDTAGGKDPSTAAKPTYSQVEGGRSFPIVIGLNEAQAIERGLKGIVIKRPQTHDLLANVITALNATLESICINDLAEHTFFAQLNIRTADGKLVQVDSRPSDAIALGIGKNVPILVEEHVLDAAQRDDDSDPTEETDERDNPPE